MLQSTMIWKESSQVFSRQLQLPSTQYRSSWKRHANHFILYALLFHCVCSYALLLFYFIAQLAEFIYFVQMYTFWYVTQTKAWKRQRGRREGRKKTSTVFKDCDLVWKDILSYKINFLMTELYLLTNLIIFLFKSKHYLVFILYYIIFKYYYILENIFIIFLNTLLWTFFPTGIQHLKFLVLK